MDQILKFFCFFCPQCIFSNEKTNEDDNQMMKSQDSIIIGEKEISFVEDFMDQV